MFVVVSGDEDSTILGLVKKYPLVRLGLPFSTKELNPSLEIKAAPLLVEGGDVEGGDVEGGDVE